MQDFLFTSGDYAILAYSQPLENVKAITGFTDVVENKGTGTLFKKEFRYSFDEESFSEYSELTSDNLGAISFEENSKAWFQFRITLLSGGPAMVKSVSLNYETFYTNPHDGFVPANPQEQTKPSAFPITYKSGAKWNPYRMGKAVRLYKDLNLMVNSLFGHEVLYYRALAQGRSKDVFLLEYSLYEHEDKQCIKVVVPNNTFPDNKLNMGPFGPDFEMPFEVQIDKSYFQAIYGDGAGPQKRDVLYFPRTNRIYEVSSSYLFRDFMNEPLYFKVTLIKWQPKSNAEPSPDLASLQDLTASVEKLFGLEQEEEKKDIANPVQFVQTTTVSDPVRDYLSSAVEITDTPISNYYLTVAEYQYNLQKTISEKLATVKLSASQIGTLTVGNTYYARFNRNVPYPNEEYYFSMKKLKYMGEDQNGNSIFEFSGGGSKLERDQAKGLIFGPLSEFFIYANEYVAGDTSEQPLFSCDMSSKARAFQEKVVKYKAIGDFSSTQDRAYSMWFKLKTNEKFSSNVTSIAADVDALTVQITYVLPHDFFVGDLLSTRRVSGGNFDLIGEIQEILSPYSVVIKVDSETFKYLDTVFPNWKSYTDLKTQLTYPTTFIDNMQGGKGVKIELLGKRFFRVIVNNKVHWFSLPNTQTDIAENKWYSIAVNISNLFSQMTLNLWEMQYDNGAKSSDLKLAYGKTIPIGKEDRSSVHNYFLVSSNSELTNIRVWNQKIETDKQPLVLNQNIVKDASRAIVIDNAIPQSKLPYISYTH